MYERLLCKGRVKFKFILITYCRGENDANSKNMMRNDVLWHETEKIKNIIAKKN
jgi:hypothetical protein